MSGIFLGYVSVYLGVSPELGYKISELAQSRYENDLLMSGSIVSRQQKIWDRKYGLKQLRYLKRHNELDQVPF